MRAHSGSSTRRCTRSFKDEAADDTALGGTRRKARNFSVSTSSQSTTMAGARTVVASWAKWSSAPNQTRS